MNAMVHNSLIADTMRGDKLLGMRAVCKLNYAGSDTINKIYARGMSGNDERGT